MHPGFFGFPDGYSKRFPTVGLLTPKLIVPFINNWFDTIQGKTNYANFWPSISYFIPPYVYSVYVKMWGAGGGGGQNGSLSVGGGGGYTYGEINVLPGMTITFVTGGKGLYREANGVRITRPVGGGGFAGTTGYGGEGGGGSFVWLNMVLQAIAGGGGGGGYSSTGEYGGAGGGLTGLDAAAVGNYGLGATQTAGGAGGYGTGIYMQGADADSSDYGGGGGGGGGLYGGGAGSNGTDGAGGGGSGYAPGKLITFTGSGSTPPNSGDGIRGTAGDGGARITSGANGLIWVTF